MVIYNCFMVHSLNDSCGRCARTPGVLRGCDLHDPTADSWNFGGKTSSAQRGLNSNRVMCKTALYKRS